MNYVNKCITGLKSFCNEMKRAPYDLSNDIHAFNNVCGLLRNSVHFKLPDNGHIFDDNLKGIQHELIRLPHKMMTIEYYVEKKDNYTLEYPIYSPRRVILAFEVDDEITNELSDRMNVPRLTDTGGAIITIIAASEQNGIWVLHPIGVRINSDWMIGLEDGQPAMEVTPVPIRPDIIHQMGMNVDDPRFLNDINMEVRVVLELCEALSCSNVHSEPLKISKSMRKKHPKMVLPKYEHHTLVIDTPKNTKSSSDYQGGTHASPRQHLRIGHIRRLNTGRKVWVNACIVGCTTEGIVDKSYTVRKRS